MHLSFPVRARSVTAAVALLIFGLSGAVLSAVAQEPSERPRFEGEVVVREVLLDVLVHDAARPCLSRADLDLLIEQGTKHSSGAILAVPVNDTVKQSGADGRIDGTVDRSGLWAAQTPQLFRLADLTVRLEAALAAGQSPTDEAAAMEAAGVRPLLVKGCSTNIKITGAGDLALAEFILQQQAVKEGQ